MGRWRIKIIPSITTLFFLHCGIVSKYLFLVSSFNRILGIVLSRGLTGSRGAGGGAGGRCSIWGRMERGAEWLRTALSWDFWDSLEPTPLMHQGKKLSVQCRNYPGSEVCLPKALPRSSPVPPSPRAARGTRQDICGSPTPAMASGDSQALPSAPRRCAAGGPQAGAKLGLDIDIESWLFERHNSLCLLQS